MNIQTEKPPVPGDNNPPEPTPFEESQELILDLYQQAEDWLDGDPIATQGQADGVQKLMRMIQAVQKEVDTHRKAEVAPLNEAKQAIQDRYNPLIQKNKGKCDIAIDTCKKALTPWLEMLEAQRRKEAEAARKLAEEKQQAAIAALRASQEAADLKARVEAEEKLIAANKASKAATRLEKTTVKASGGVGRATSLRTTYTPVLTDLSAAIKHYWSRDKGEFETLVMTLAKRDVGMGKRSIPGFTVNEERVVV